MIKSIQFKNFKVLRDCTLPLSQFTLLIGPNGTGKSTALNALRWIANGARIDQVASVGTGRGPGAEIGVIATMGDPFPGLRFGAIGNQESGSSRFLEGAQETPQTNQAVVALVNGAQVFALEAPAIAQPVNLDPVMWMSSNGAGLAGVLDRLRDEHPERFEALNEELGRLIPEFDRILFGTPAQGMRSFKLRQRGTGHVIPAVDLSQGTLLALAILTIAYLPDPPPIVGLEEPDRGLHPRLLRDIQDAMYRLAYPKDCGDKRQPVQVIATTHSPYMLDLFRDHPEEVVIAEKLEGDVSFARLSDRADLDDILKDVHLGEAWYSGALGGVPVEP